MARENYRLRKMARLVRDCPRVLDVGCTSSPNPWLGNGFVAGLDTRKADGLPGNYTEMRVGDALDLPGPFGPGSFDALLAGELLEHVENPTSLLRCFRDTLRPGGLLVVSTPNPLSPIELLLSFFLVRKYFYCAEHVCLIPPRWLIRIMENAGFQGVRLRSGGFPAPLVGQVPLPWQFSHQIIATGRKPRDDA